jgi:hypothetical protein
VKGISVWTGSALGALTQIGCTTGVNASAKVNTINTTVYYIRVGSSNGVGGNFAIQAGIPPTNDDFDSAIMINTGFAPFNDVRDIIGASTEIGDPAATCGAISTFRTVWYKYTPLANNVMSLNTTGSGYDTVLSVWTGAGLGALTQAGCNDNTAALATSALILNTAPGVTYYIRVSSKEGTVTSLIFNTSVESSIGEPITNYFTTATPTLTWNRVTDATEYEVQVSKSDLFTVLVYTTAPPVPASQLSVTTPPLTEGIYYWRVSANGGVTWSPADRFVVDLP